MPAPGEFLNPNSWAANAPGQAAWFGLQMLAPNIASLVTGQPPPALPNLPEMPGKAPATEDPRIAGAVGEAANLGLNFLPLPGAGLAVDAGCGILGLIRRAVPEVNAGHGILGLSGPESLASKIASLYNPPVKSPRPFAADYPLGAPADATGRLTADIEGRPLVAEYVAGRRLVHGPDEPLGAPEMVSAATQATGGSPQAVAHSARSEIGGDAGRYIREVDRRSGNVLSRDIFYDNSLPEAKANRVIAHEFGHAIDEIAGRIPTIGLNTELRQVYNTLLTGQERTRNLTGPQHVGYKGDDVGKELMAEAIRAYMADPNYLKSVARKTAAAIRAAVNVHPTLNRTIQFNTIAGLAAMNGIDPDSLPIPRQRPPVFPQ